MEKERQTQINPRMAKLHSYIAQRRMRVLNIGQSRECAYGEVMDYLPTTRCERGQ